MLNWAVMSFTYIRFHHAMKAQKIDKKSFLPVVSRLQPYDGYWHSSGPSSSFGKWRAFRWTWEACYWWELLVCLTFGLTCENYRVQGYAVFLDGKWEVATFVFNYGIVSLASVICLLSYTDYTAIADRTSYCHRDFLEDLQAHKVAQVQGCWPSQRPGVLRGFGWTLPPGTGEWPSFQVR